MRRSAEDNNHNPILHFTCVLMDNTVLCILKINCNIYIYRLISIMVLCVVA